MAAGKEAGARRADGFALRLAPIARAGFLPALTREYPALADRYLRHYTRHNVGPTYHGALVQRLRTLQQIHGYPLNKFDSPTRANRRSASTPAFATTPESLFQTPDWFPSPGDSPRRLQSGTWPQPPG